ncbi:hypothetical protein M0802_015814 [Mischocyttarus mexicanus]|nr:hypothetical protein M0802_015814 [Mischocyttarus mexicanus]
MSTHQVRLLIDPGSEISFISESLVNCIRSQRGYSSIEIIGVGGVKTTRTRGMVTITIHSNYRPLSVTLSAHILKTVTTKLPTTQITHHEDWPHLANLQLADPDFLISRDIDIIVGADYYGRIIKSNIIRHSVESPIAQLSIFGWLVLGPVISSSLTSTLTHYGSVRQCSENIDQLLAKFWIQEEPPVNSTSSLTLEEQECESHFKQTHSRDSSGRYIVRIPLKLSPSTLGNSYTTAHKRLQQLTRRLIKDPDYSSLYHDFMKEYELLNHMVEIPEDSIKSQVQYYLPHHGVLRPDKATTKLRVVFNGSSTSSSGHSVNDLMHTGANLLLNIADVLLWIRSHRHLFMTDITKMYRQIKVHPDDWDLQRILWLDKQGKEKHFHLTTVTYGTKAAPFLAIRALMQLAEDEGHRFPLAMPSFERGRYVDDIFGGADSPEELLQVATQLRQLCSLGCFPLAKWHSTHPKILQEISPNEEDNSPISLDDCSTKILGLNWSPQDDSFNFSSVTPTHFSKISKRQILSEVATIFDPLGFSSPVVIKAKMLLQKLWLLKVGWDDSLPSHVISEWRTIREDLVSLAKLSIPRWFISKLRRQLKDSPAAELTAADTETARIFWVKATQQVFFPDELKALKKNSQLSSSHPFSRLTAFIDHEGVIRPTHTSQPCMEELSSRSPTSDNSIGSSADELQ